MERAVTLGKDRVKLQEYRTYLLENRNNLPLFDTNSVVRGLEALYEEMWSDYSRGVLPQPDLRNLGIYLDIGCEIEHEKTELLTMPDYEALYQRRLAYRNAFLPFGPDQRLWPEGMEALGNSDTLVTTKRNGEVTFLPVRNSEELRRVRQ